MNDGVYKVPGTRFRIAKNIVLLLVSHVFRKPKTASRLTDKPNGILISAGAIHENSSKSVNKRQVL